MLTFLSWNLLKYLGSDDPEQVARCAGVPEVLDSLRPRVAAVQEVQCDEAEFVALADSLGMNCHVQQSDGPRVALDPGRSGHGMGLMWANDVEAVPGSLRIFDRPLMHHGMVAAELVVDGVQIVCASTHFTPEGLNLRRDEATRVALVLRRLGNPMIILGSDRNAIGSTRRLSKRIGGDYYDPDPYAELPWDPSFISKCRFDDVAGYHWADREPMAVLERAGLLDVAPAINAAWEPTVGHFGGVPRRIDGLHASPPLIPTAQSVEVIRTVLTVRTSDHLPVLGTFALGTPPRVVTALAS